MYINILIYIIMYVCVCGSAFFRWFDSQLRLISKLTFVPFLKRMTWASGATFWATHLQVVTCQPQMLVAEPVPREDGDAHSEVLK